MASEPLMLALVPVESKQVVGAYPAARTPPIVRETLKLAETIAIEVAENAAVADLPSLEEEAGLTSAHPAINQYEPAETTAKLSTQTADQVATHLNQKVASQGFVANKPVKAPSSKSALAALGVAGTLLVWLVLQGYSDIKTLTTADVVVKPSTPFQPQFVVVAPAGTPTVAPTELAIATVASNQERQLAESPSAINITDTEAGRSEPRQASKINVSAFDNKVLKKQNMLEDIIEVALKKSPTENPSHSNDEAYLGSDASYDPEPRNDNKRKPLQLISQATSSQVDPTLMAAYQAYIHGDNAAAQRQYRQVLQRDVRNVDALLGMAAIAQRQSRDADATGWYQKVLDIEPKNTIALSISISSQANADVVGTESHIKSMLAQQPDAANLYAGLGNLYAEQNQWSSAQEAYFNASRLDLNNADYAFNLAISLDQLGKASLALKQYERVLELLNQSGSMSPDRATLEARINQLH